MQRHMLSIEISTVSKARLGIFRIKSCVLHEPFLVNVKVRNLADRPFPGGQMKIVIKWPLALGERVDLDYNIPPLRPKEEKFVDSEPYEVDAATGGYAHFLCEVKANDGGPVELYSGGRRIINPKKMPIYSAPVKTWREIYSRWTIIVATLTLIISALTLVFN